MKDLAPQIFRQRLLMEGITCRGFDAAHAIAFTREFFGSSAVESMQF